MAGPSSETTLLNLEPAAATFLDDVLAGLKTQPRHLPCKYFYDDRGSRLFDRICQLDEYYLTRAELSIMEQSAREMAARIGPRAMLIEYGSGSSVKTPLLLDPLDDPVAYVPVDISREHLQRTADELAADYPRIEVLPVCADFTRPFELPTPRRRPAHTAVYFPGSTIGNFAPPAARTMLAEIARLCGSGGGLLIGIDLQKDAATIEAAYNDAASVTAEFNLNLLRRINRELDADFDLGRFEHLARYDRRHGRIEMYLVSQCDQTVRVGGESFTLVCGEWIRTEFSYKYRIDGFAHMAADAGLTLMRHWTDAQQRFSVLHLAVANSGK